MLDGSDARPTTRVFPEDEAVVRALRSQPAACAVLFELGVPAEFFGRRFQAAEVLRLLPGASALVCFGTSGIAASIAVDVVTGQVVHVVPTSGASSVVNAELPLFCACIAAVKAELPGYGPCAEPSEWDAAADRLASTLAMIDDAASVPDTFWATFIDDVRMGDFGTQAMEAQ